MNGWANREAVAEHDLRVAWLGEAYLLARRLDEACTHARLALEFSRAYKARGNEAYALRPLGAIAAQRKPAKVEQAEVY